MAYASSPQSHRPVCPVRPSRNTSLLFAMRGAYYVDWDGSCRLSRVKRCRGPMMGGTMPSTIPTTTRDTWSSHRVKSQRWHRALPRWGALAHLPAMRWACCEPRGWSRPLRPRRSRRAALWAVAPLPYSYACLLTAHQDPPDYPYAQRAHIRSV